MANGDIAAAAGLAVVAGTADRRMGYDEINKTRDYVANEMAARTSGLAAKANSSHTHAAGDVTSGTFSTSRIPDLSAAKITSGTLSAARLPSTLEANGPNDSAYARTATGSGWFAVWMNSSNQFMRNTSSCRYKEDIEPADLDVAAILNLEPVTYHRIGQDPGTRELGLIAERCVGVPHLVSWDVPRTKSGKPRRGAKARPEGVRYETVLPVMLLAVARHQAERIAELEAGLDRALSEFDNLARLVAGHIAKGGE